MPVMMEAACGCQVGKIRKNNEDNFFFNGSCLELENDGLERPLALSRANAEGRFMAIFDGMGGENFGEVASYTAANALREKPLSFGSAFAPMHALTKLSERLNLSVVDAARERMTERMGTTMVGIYVAFGQAWICNIGDSRAYRLQNGELIQLSMDHVESHIPKGRKKAPLTQHLGIDPEYLQIEPFIHKERIHRGDRFLLCSDGLTDMLTDSEISAIMQDNERVAACTDRLIEAALEHGGRDNITAIVCQFT